MLGPIGSNIMSIFRLLSPDEIDKYIESKEVQKIAGSMAASGEEMTYEGHQEPEFAQPKEKKFSTDHQAEIIPIGKFKKDNHIEEEKKEAEEELPVEMKAEVKKLKPKSNASAPKSQLESIGILSASSLRQIEQERLEKESKNKDSTTAFLIRERMKMRESKKRLIEQHAYKSYQMNAAQEFYDTDDLLDEEANNDSSTKGILVNKKQF